SVVSSALFQNAGTWVENSVVGVAVWSVGGYRTLVVNVPWTWSPLVLIDWSCPACTSEMKNGLNGTVTRVCPPGLITSTDSQLTASSTRKKIQNPRKRWGGVGRCCSGVP